MSKIVKNCPKLFFAEVLRMPFSHSLRNTTIMDNYLHSCVRIRQIIPTHVFGETICNEHQYFESFPLAIIKLNKIFLNSFRKIFKNYHHIFFNKKINFRALWSQSSSKRSFSKKYFGFSILDIFKNVHFQFWPRLFGKFFKVIYIIFKPT